MKNVNQIINDLNISINSIILDVDSLNVTQDDVKNVLEKVKNVFVVSERTPTINQYRVRFRRNRGEFSAVYRSVINFDIKIGIDLIISNNVDEKLISYIDYNKNIRCIYTENEFNHFGFKKIDEFTYERNVENTLVDDFYIKVKKILPVYNSYSNEAYETKYEIEKDKKAVIYTCITKDYDVLMTPKMIDTKSFDYICFTNCEMKEVFPWKIINLSELQNNLNLSDILFSRYVKMNPHELLKEYDLSIWIDGNVSIIGEIKKFTEYLNDENYILTFSNPRRISVFSEIEKSTRRHVNEFENLNRLLKFLISNQYLNDNKLIQSNVLVRKHNINNCIKIMNDWWELTKKFTSCDQTSFNYVMNKNKAKYVSVNWDFANKMFFVCNFMHGGRK